MASEIVIRAASVADAPALLAIYAPYVRDTAITFEYEVPSVEEFARRIDAALERYPYLVAERDGEPVGFAYAGPFKARAAYAWAVETSIYVMRDLRHAGVGGAMHAALEASLGAMGITNMCACITVPPAGAVPDARANFNSRDFHTHMGYRLVGEFQRCGYKFGTWYNMIWMEKIIGDHRDAADGGQPAVVSFGDVLPQLAAEGVLRTR